MRRYVWHLALCVAGTLLVSCGHKAQEQKLDEALQLAGDNRDQLEKVLNYYADDSLGLAAARFLIANMPGHYSYADTDSVVSYSRQAADIVRRMQGAEAEVLRDSINACAARCGLQKIPKVYDCTRLTADYLIRNIDDAIQVWKHGLWARHLSFDDFCEYLLPYKIEELQLTDDWRTRMRGFQCQGLDRLSWCDQYSHSPLAAAKVVNRNLYELMKPDHAANIEYQQMRIEDAVQMPMGTCDYYVMLATVLLRSQGIPVARDFTPHWAYRNNGHSWNVVLGSDGKEVPFTGICTQPGEEHKPDERLPKVYRSTYAQNDDILMLNRREKFVPRLFRNVFMRDVTDHYTRCYDVQLQVDASYGSYVYLAVYDSKGWAPVSFAMVKRGRAVFRDMGCDVLYMPVRYDANGTQEPAGTPFILDFQGNMRRMDRSEGKIHEMTLHRKYPTLNYVNYNMERMIDGEFQASNDPAFSSYIVVHKISDGHAYGYEQTLPDSLPPYRYWRYKQDREFSYCNMAEMCFYARGAGHKRIDGTVIGTPGSYMDRGGRREAVFDDDALTFFDAPEPHSSWVGMDFGKPVSVGSIYYLFRGDGNSIEPGDTYQLSCWKDNGWKVLATHRAVHPWLVFHDITQGSLFLLQDLTRGAQVRPFTYEEGQQVWW